MSRRMLELAEQQTLDALRQRPDLEDAAGIPYYVFFDLVKPAGV